MTNNKSQKNDEQTDDIENFLAAEKERTASELRDIQEELKKMYTMLTQHLEVLDKETKAALINGDDKTWISLTSQKGILLERLSELEHIIRKE